MAVGQPAAFPEVLQAQWALRGLQRGLLHGHNGGPNKAVVLKTAVNNLWLLTSWSACLCCEALCSVMMSFHLMRRINGKWQLGPTVGGCFLGNKDWPDTHCSADNFKTSRLPEQSVHRRWDHTCLSRRTVWPHKSTAVSTQCRR